MKALLVSWFSSFGQWFLAFILGAITKDVKQAIQDWLAKRQADKLAEENAKRAKEALEKGDPDGLAQKTEDLLNGRTPIP